MIKQKRIAMLQTCVNYWQRWECTTPWWRGLKTTGTDSSPLFSFHVAAIDLPDHIAQTNPDVAFVKCQRSKFEIDGIESKGLMLRALIWDAMRFKPTHFLFTDADIIPPASLPVDLEGVPDDAYCTAERIDLSAEETTIILHGGASAKAVIEAANTRSPNAKKTGMGWFQLVPSSIFARIFPTFNWNHPGYDLVDFEMNKRANALADTTVCLSSHFLHLYHGNDGANWKGSKIEW